MGNKDGQKNKRLKILIIITAVLGIGCLLGGFILSNSNLFKKDDKTNVDKLKKSKESDYSKKISKLYKSVINSNDIYCGYYKLFTNKKMTFNDLNNEEKLKMISYSVYASDTDNISGWENKTYSKEEFEKVAKELFDSSITHQTISGCPSLEYDSSKGEYKVVYGDCTTTCDKAVTRAKIVQSVAKGGILEFSVKVVFGNDGKYYADYARTKQLSIDIDEYGNIKNYNDINKGSLYKIVFNKENDNYMFSYVEPVKE